MKLKEYLSRLVAGLLLIVIVVPFPAVQAAAEFPYEATDEITTTNTMGDGEELQAIFIDGPPQPSPEYSSERTASMVTSLNRATTLSNFPSYSWVFGCSAVSSAMIAAYYDNNGYPNMYTGPTNGGVMPITDTGWGTWSDGSNTFPNNPLVASRAGLDGRGVSEKGSIDDYWVAVNSAADDPYITGSWTQHTWGTAVGDYLKTSQSYFLNIDGSTWFYTYSGNGKLYCDSMPSLYDSTKGFYLDDLDGTYGRKLFYEAKGYTVDNANCYAQQTDNQITGGFSLADLQAEIDAGHPVLINVTGHSMVAFGYSGSTIYIRDTWSSNPNITYSMTWGGSYDGRELLSVSVVHLDAAASEPGAFSKSSPANGAVNQWTSLTLSWESSSGATSYEYCYDDTDDGSCTGWTSTGTSRSVEISGLAADTPYYWQVRANNAEGTTYANGGATAFWSFTTMDPSILTESVFLPILVRD